MTTASTGRAPSIRVETSEAASARGAVVVVGRTSHVGRALEEELTRRGAVVRMVGRRDDLAAAARDAGTVVHLAGTLRPGRGTSYAEANVETVRRTLGALTGDVRRVILLSYVGADPAASNPYLRSKGAAERLVRAAPCETVVLRATLIHGPPADPGPSTEPFIARGSRPVVVLGDGSQRYAPVFVGDVAQALARAALDRAAAPGTLALAGPEVLTADEFVAALNPPGTAVRHVPPRLARALGRVAPSLTPALVDVLLGDSMADGSPLAADALGLRLRGVAEVHRGRGPS